MAFDLSTAQPTNQSKSGKFKPQTAKPVQAESTGFFGSEPVKTLFRSGGQITGGLLGAGRGAMMGAPAGPIPATIGAIGGGILGALGGEALRQTGQAFETGKGIPL